MAYCTLDDRDVLQRSRVDPEGLLSQLGDRGALIDEVQRAPELFLAIKAVVDRDRRPGRYLLTGSNQPTVRGGVGDSLLGRAAYRTLRPLTLSELRYDDVHAGWSFLFDDSDDFVLAELERRASLSGRLDWREMVRVGGFPRVLAATPSQRLRLLDDYVSVFASRDVREVIGIESTERFESFLRLIAARTACELNLSSMSQALGLAVNTVRRWTDALERSYLVHRIPPYSRNAGHRVVKSPKIFMVDSALAMAAAREGSPSGFHLETMVASDLGVWRDVQAGRAVYHWRLASQQEVDFVLEENSRLIAVEVKGADNVSHSDARHLRRFCSDHTNSVRGLVISADPEIRLVSNNVIAAPWWAVL